MFSLRGCTVSEKRLEPCTTKLLAVDLRPRRTSQTRPRIKHLSTYNYYNYNNSSNNNNNRK